MHIFAVTTIEDAMTSEEKQYTAQSIGIRSHFARQVRSEPWPGGETLSTAKVREHV